MSEVLRSVDKDKTSMSLVPISMKLSTNVGMSRATKQLPNKIQNKLNNYTANKALCI